MSNSGILDSHTGRTRNCNLSAVALFRSARLFRTEFFLQSQSLGYPFDASLKAFSRSAVIYGVTFLFNLDPADLQIQREEQFDVARVTTHSIFNQPIYHGALLGDFRSANGRHFAERFDQVGLQTGNSFWAPRRIAGGARLKSRVDGRPFVADLVPFHGYFSSSSGRFLGRSGNTPFGSVRPASAV